VLQTVLKRQISSRDLRCAPAKFNKPTEPELPVRSVHYTGQPVSTAVAEVDKTKSRAIVKEADKQKKSYSEFLQLTPGVS